MERISLFPALILLLAFAPTTTRASDFQSPRTASLGGAGHAAPFLNDAIFLNPSYISLDQSYGLSANYLSYTGGPNPTGSLSNVSIQDGHGDNLFQAGMAYTRRDDAVIFSGGASKAVVERLGIGIGGKVVFPNDGLGTQFTDAVFSVSGIALNWFNVGLIVDNLIDPPIAQAHGFYREVILGTKLSAGSWITGYFDPHWTPDYPGGTFGYEAGAEIPMFTDFHLRGGMFQNSEVASLNLRGNGFGLGVGWLAPRISFDYGYQRVLGSVSTYAHIFGATIFF